MAGAHVQTVQVGGANVTSVTSAAITTTSGNLLVASVGGWRSSAQVTHTVTDSKSNTWSENPASPRNPDANTRHHQYYAQNISGGSSHTFTSTAAQATYQTLIVSEFSGMATANVLDQSAGATGNSTSPSSGTTNVRTQADEVLVGTLGTADTINNGTLTAGSGYTIPTNGSNKNYTNYVSAQEYAIMSATGGDAATFTISSEPWGCIIGTYKAAVAAASLPLKPNSMLPHLTM